MKDLDWTDWDEEEILEESYEILGLSNIDGYIIMKKKKDGNMDFWHKLEKLWFYDIKIKYQFVKVYEWDNYENYYLIKILCPIERVIKYFKITNPRNHLNKLHEKYKSNF